MMSQNNKDIQQDEIDKLNINHGDDLNRDINNIIILIRNELNTLTGNLEYYEDDNKKKIKKKLNKILNEIIDIRKK